MREYGKELAMADYRRHVYLPECGQAYPVEIRKKRQQLDNTLPYTMQKTTAFTVGDAPLLWAYWREHYSGRRFPVSQIAVIWHGRQQEEDVFAADAGNFDGKPLLFTQYASVVLV